MKFYFKLSSIQSFCKPVYWQKWVTWMFENSVAADDGYRCIPYGKDEQICLLYCEAGEKVRPADFYVALGHDTEPFFLSKHLLDEPEGKPHGVGLLPVDDFLYRDGAKHVWVVVDEENSTQEQLFAHWVKTLCGMNYEVDMVTASTLESDQREHLSNQLKGCRKIISFSKNICLNQWLYLLFRDDFILFNDDQSSPLRYSYLELTHPHLRQKVTNPLADQCKKDYGIVTKQFRHLVAQVRSESTPKVVPILPSAALDSIRQQLLQSRKPQNRLQCYAFRVRSSVIQFPFVLHHWAVHKQALKHLMDFVECHPQYEETQRLLVSYVLNYFRPEFWPNFEHHYADHPQLIQFFQTFVEQLSRNMQADYGLHWAYGTYLRALQTKQVCSCDWGCENSLAPCLDDVLQKQYEKIVPRVSNLYDKKNFRQALGLRLLRTFLLPLVFLKKDVESALIQVGHALLDLDEYKGHDGDYGERLFFKAILWLLEGKQQVLISLLESSIDGIRTQGFLSQLALFMVKYYPQLTRESQALLSLEKDEFLVKKPLVLQMRSLAHLLLGNKEGYLQAQRELSKSTNYFCTYNKDFEKWFIQSELERLQGHHARTNRYLYIHQQLGNYLSLWTV